MDRYFHPDDVERADDEFYLREMQREHDERVCDLVSPPLLAPMWFSEDDLKETNASERQ